MKKKLIFNRVFWIGFVFFIALMFLLPDKASLQVRRSGIGNSFPMNIYQREWNPKMESVLYQLMKVYFFYGLEEAKAFAKQRGIDMEGDAVRIVAEAVSAGISKDFGVTSYKQRFKNMHFQKQGEDQQPIVSTLSRQIRAFGGKVEITYRHLIQSVVPLYSLQDIAYLPAVKYLRLPKKPVPFAVSEGVAETGADLWQAVASYRSGENAKVCILDLGFSGYSALLGTDLPDSVTARSFRSDSDISITDHGTVCAEVVHDMAPDAELFLVNFGTELEHHQAVDWIINQEVDVISCSVGWFNIGAGDGTGPICEDVEKAYDSGIIWVNAAGNNAETHWEGAFRDPDDDTWCNFEAPGDPENEFFGFNVVSGTTYRIYLNWDDWGIWNGTDYTWSEGNDYDLFLYDSGGFYLASSNNDQTIGAEPEEAVEYTATYTGLCFIRIYKFETIRDCTMELFFWGLDAIATQYQVSSGSLAIPSDSPYVVTVGATLWTDDSYESYSSQGPTSDGRVKPDLCAPVGITTATRGANAFDGTSAATPHVAGAFALLKGKTPFTLDQINEILEARALDLGTSGKDNRFGHGRLNLSNESGTGVQIRRKETAGLNTMDSQTKKKGTKAKVPLKKKVEKKEKKDLEKKKRI